MNFNVLKAAVAKQFDRMQKYPMFRVGTIVEEDQDREAVKAADRDAIYATYLASFPEGQNPIYRERTEHDCSCCKNFIRNIGNVVAVIDGKLESVWDINVPDEPGYQVVANALSAKVKAMPIADVFLHFERTAGTDRSFEDIANASPKRWDHFFVNIAPQFVLKSKEIATALAGKRDAATTLLRALNELTDDAVETVQDLIAQNSLARAEDFKFAFNQFVQLKTQFSKLKTDEARTIYAWTKAQTVHGAVSGIRNSAIGTLLVDLSDGKELDDSLKAFEHKVGADNFKRPTTLATKAQIEQMKKALTEAGLISALPRRYATIHDLTINNVLHANRNTKKALTGDVFDDLAGEVSVGKVKNLDKVEEMPIEKFLADVLPRAESIEVMFSNAHASNLVSLITAQDPTAGKLFKWDNRFSWTYNGNMADAIKERVKAAGGAVDGDLCCRLAWEYRDDLDFHMREPGGSKIYYMNRRQTSACGGVLDLDANGADGERDDPAENIVYADRRKMKDGTYELQVNNYSRRSEGRGFEVEIEFDGQRFNIVYDKILRTGETVTVAKIKYSKATGKFEIIESMPSSQTSKNVWGLATQQFHTVSAVMLSPNYWDGEGVGNKHYFFMLDGCVNDGTARGFFNEFLRGDLDKYRKGLEMLGSKLKVDESAEQLSGLGFSSTMRNELMVRVKGSFNRMIKVVF
jgi:hypothetical protein